MSTVNGQFILSSLDKAKTQLYHFNTVIISGIGFFTHAYDLFCISSIINLLGRLYYPADQGPGTLPMPIIATLFGIPLWGAIMGQLFFGTLGDHLGRKKVYGMTIMIMAISTLCSGLSFGHTGKSVMASLCFFRFWTGFGIGGDYPLSATIMAEFANKRSRGAFMAAIYGMQGFGILASGAFATLLANYFNNKYQKPAQLASDLPVYFTVPQADFLWRIILMFGAVPAMLTYYWRTRMPETARFTVLVLKDKQKAVSEMASILNIDADARADEFEFAENREYRLFSGQFFSRHGWHLVGAASAWFFFDICHYSQILFNKDIYTAIGWLPPNKTMNGIDEVFRMAKSQVMLASFSIFPGYWCAIMVIDRLGRRFNHLVGFLGMTTFLLVLSVPYDYWRGKVCGSDVCVGHQVWFVFFYSLTFFFATFGPSCTTFIYPAELFPARFRSTLHGLCASCGRMGAIIGSYAVLYTADATRIISQWGGLTGDSVRRTLVAFAIANMLGFIISFLLLPETARRSLEEISGEAKDDEFTMNQNAGMDAPVLNFAMDEEAVRRVV